MSYSVHNSRGLYVFPSMGVVANTNSCSANVIVDISISLSSASHCCFRVCYTCLYVFSFLLFRSCGVPWHFGADNTALITTILKEKRSEIVTVCKQSLKQWLMTACRPEKVMVDEIARDVKKQYDIQS